MGWIVFGVLIAIALFFVSIYNRLVSGRNAYKNAFAQIDVQLTRRHDLIPNLVETAKGYIKHERETLEAVIAARNSAVSGLKRAAANPGDPASVQQLAGAEAQLNGALGRLFAVAEAYPDLKANQNMMQLSEELTTTENKVAFARQAFNDAVMNYNNARRCSPTASSQACSCSRRRSCWKSSRRRSAPFRRSSSRSPAQVNFFKRQDEARRATRRLVVLFGLAVIAVVASVDLVVFLLMRQGEAHAHGYMPPLTEWLAVHPRMVAGTTLMCWRSSCSRAFTRRWCWAAAVESSPARSAARVSLPTRPIRCSGGSSTWSRKWRSLPACRCPRSTCSSRRAASTHSRRATMHRTPRSA
jgi:LemA protein